MVIVLVVAQRASDVGFAQKSDETKGEMPDDAFVGPVKDGPSFEGAFEFAETIFDAPELFVLSK